MTEQRVRQDSEAMADRDMRRQERESLFLAAQLRIDGHDEPVAVKLRNISDFGIMAEGLMRVSRGDRLSVTLRNIGWVAGTVAWAAGDRCGIAFDHEVASHKVLYPVDDADLPESSGRKPELDGTPQG
ncbi:PilZ domain-containing protein [Croceicoccus sp. F390]|uniref:PilZ domain-containing protein n=1 Tax=Croceicoccus esteveae TaxID=3075597 RepID=A0ABU2ZM44_9SPHN|nr:PilZ domain-containing protein [Croceicoccus sp. F390]MDT0576512.1 PilZ domain-containing protein [Croceicoccus sp. F390]